jgi:hypothetical protein
MSVALRHSLTGRLQTREDGWSWSCFFGCGFLGLPLFSRGLYVWGAVMVVFDITVFILDFVPTERAANLASWATIAAFAAAVFFGLKANRMAIDRALAQGWEFADRRAEWFR